MAPCEQRVEVGGIAGGNHREERIGLGGAALARQATGLPVREPPPAGRFRRERLDRLDALPRARRIALVPALPGELPDRLEGGARAGGLARELARLRQRLVELALLRKQAHEALPGPGTHGRRNLAVSQRGERRAHG